MKADFNIQLDGYPAANRDAEIQLVHQTTGREVKVKPFLDGTALIRGLDPGPYQLKVTHPNLITPIVTRNIRLFDQPAPTFVPIPVPADLFRDTPIRDIPDADLGPVQQTATAARDALVPIGHKIAGEAIRAADWNTLVGAVSDLATATLELTRLVSPKGHDHPEIAEKIGEVQENIRRFAEAFGRSLLELRREIETARLRQNATEVLTAAGAAQPVRDRVLGRIADLQATIQADTPTFTHKLATAGRSLITEVQTLAQDQEDPDTFLKRAEVNVLTAAARQYTEAGTQTKPESELMTYQRTTTVAGGKFVKLFDGRP